ncbi:SEC-C metal-binding domain-containing protein [Verrucomicrobiota bacterium]
MGVMAESMVAYAQPLLDEADGSKEQMQHALSITQICWNLALLPETEQEESLATMRPALKMDDAEFADFRQSVIAPMIARHHEMFPNMPRMDSQGTPPPREKKYAGTGRNARCPCNSGKKYKRCCGI